MAGDDQAGAGPARDQALRLAEHAKLRALRAERLARLRLDAPGARVEAEAALREFLEALMPEGTPEVLPAEAPGPAAAVLPFHRPAAPDPEVLPACDLDRLPGAGPALVGALRRAGVGSLAEVAGLEPGELASRLGPIGRLVPASDWIASARAAATR